MSNPLLDAALTYVRQGFSVISIRPRDKKPYIAWQQYQKIKATESQVVEWSSQWPDANIGIVTGAISGIIVLDLAARTVLAGATG